MDILVEKLDIVSNAITLNKKFEKKTNTRLTAIEEKIITFLTLPEFSK